MKKFLLILGLTIFTCPAFEASATTTTSSNMEEIMPGDRKMKKHRKATYGKRKGTKGTSCRKAYKKIGKSRRVLR